MAQENKDEKQQYPVRSLHDFLFELDKEWTKFRNGTLIGLGSSVVLFLIALFFVLRGRHFGLNLVGFILLILALIVLAYSIYAMVAQYRFLNKWERRIGLLLHMEEQMLSEKLGDSKT
jgi:hypothetical protein